MDDQGRPDDRHWTASGTCSTAAPDELFVQGAAQRAAREMCAGCPVRLDCLVDALDNEVPFGVWGGLTERERRALLRRHPDVVSWRERLTAEPALAVPAGRPRAGARAAVRVGDGAVRQAREAVPAG